MQDGIESRIDGIKARTPEVELQAAPLVWKRENWFETKGSEQGNSWSNWGQKRPQVDRRGQCTCVYACLAREREREREACRDFASFLRCSKIDDSIDEDRSSGTIRDELLYAANIFFEHCGRYFILNNIIRT